MDYRTFFRGKKVLVTGGTGFIGSGIVRDLLSYEPETVRIFSRDESKQCMMAEELHGRENLRFFIGDVRDLRRLTHAMEGVDVVFHTAAMKHVPACEYNPFEAVQTNILGMQNVVEAAMAVEAERVILTSTDKAANPSSTMGASKLMAEKLATAATFYKGKRRTIFASVRFGNVLGSRGSVVPVFIRQILSNHAVRLTNGKMTRFVMGLSEAVDLIFKATILAKGGEVFVLRMPSVCLSDLAKVLIDATAGRNGKSPSSVQVEEIGERPGEKEHEELLTVEEASRALELDKLFILTPPLSFSQVSYTYPDARKARIGSYLSKDAPTLSCKEIHEMLAANGLLHEAVKA
ncbi:MAG: polysaccharide biosynthesis protein [Armatimonadetes bacterium]|nr:polysaccharide biosynthesis protein [Armatimonadota bacterium]